MLMKLLLIPENYRVCCQHLCSGKDTKLAAGTPVRTTGISPTIEMNINVLRPAPESPIDGNITVILSFYNA